MDFCFRFYVYARFKAGVSLSAEHIHHELQDIHGDEAPCFRTIFRWAQSIRAETFELKKQGGPGRTIMTGTP